MRAKNISKMSLNEVPQNQQMLKQPLKMEEYKRNSLERVPSISETEGVTLDWSTFNHINHDVLKLKTSLLKLKRVMQEDMGCESRRDSYHKDYMADVLNVMEKDFNSNSQYTSLIALESQYTSLITAQTEQLDVAALEARLNKFNLPNEADTTAAHSEGTEPSEETKFIAFEENEDLKRELILLHQKLEEKDRRIKNLENLLSMRNYEEPPSMIHSVPNTPSMATVNRATQTKRARPASCGRNLSQTVVNSDNTRGGFRSGLQTIWTSLGVHSLNSDSSHIIKQTSNSSNQEVRKPFRNSSPIHSRISRHKKRQVDEPSKSILPASSAKLLGFNKRTNEKEDRGRSPSGGRHTAKRAESPRISEKSLIPLVNTPSVPDRPLRPNRLRGELSQSLGQEDGSSGSEISNASCSEASVSTHSDISKSNTSIASSVGLSHLRKVSAPMRGSTLRDKYIPRKLD